MTWPCSFVNSVPQTVGKCWFVAISNILFLLLGTLTQLEWDLKAGVSTKLSYVATGSCVPRVKRRCVPRYHRCSRWVKSAQQHRFSARRKCHAKWPPSGTACNHHLHPRYTFQELGKQVPLGWEPHLSAGFCVYRFPAFFRLLCLLWLSDCQRIKNNTPN